MNLAFSFTSRFLSKVFVLLVVTLSIVQAELQFKAECNADGVHAYRHMYTLLGEDMGREWQTSEKFYNTWIFEFDGKDTIFIDGKKATITYFDGVDMIISEPSNGTPQIWVYALDLEMREIVGAEVNSLAVSTGVKTRAVSFNCNWNP